MIVMRSINRMANFSRKNRGKGLTIGFVPTMGALHQGHLSLIRRARKENDIVVVSIFVNPTQFGPKEDFRKYPKTLKQDSSLCKREGVDIIFSPEAKAMYQADYRTYVSVQGLSEVLCGRSRPGHFKGVATVVTKLFNIVCPDTAYFGQKDLQQALIMQKMVRDLNIPVRIKVVPCVRAKDGLALSSRNVYLKAQERKAATVLYEALRKARDLIRRGNDDSRSIISEMKRIIARRGITKIDYISIVGSDNLEPIKKINPVRNSNLKGRSKISNGVNNHCFIALAVWVGKTRLIDNIVIKTYA